MLGSAVDTLCVRRVRILVSWAAASLEDGCLRGRSGEARSSDGATGSTDVVWWNDD